MFNLVAVSSKKPFLKFFKLEYIFPLFLQNYEDNFDQDLKFISKLHDHITLFCSEIST